MGDGQWDRLGSGTRGVETGYGGGTPGLCTLRQGVRLRPQRRLHLRRAAAQDDILKALKGPVQPVALEPGLVEVQEASDQECVVIEEPENRLVQLSQAIVLVVVDGPQESLGRFIVEVLPDESSCLWCRRMTKKLSLAEM